jgi:hypothetical protein
MINCAIKNIFGEFDKIAFWRFNNCRNLRIAPRAKIPTSGWFKIGVPKTEPKVPTFVTVYVPPVMSGFNFPASCSSA